MDKKMVQRVAEEYVKRYKEEGSTAAGEYIKRIVKEDTVLKKEVRNSVNNIVLRKAGI